MGESFLIALREGFEAALVVSIVLAFVRRGPLPQLARWVWVGTVAAVGTATLAGIALHLTIEELTGAARLRTFAAISVAAGGLLTWMIFWMRTHGRELRARLEQRAGNALAEASSVGLALLAFAAVAREGLETALFLVSTTSTSSPGDVITGTLSGLGVACVLGIALYHGSKRINMRLFFDVTIGWDPRPSVEQAAGYVLCLVPVGWMYFMHQRATPPRASAGIRPGVTTGDGTAASPRGR